MRIVVMNQSTIFDIGENFIIRKRKILTNITIRI